MTRKTEQRRWIRYVFENTPRPLTPQEVLNAAQQNISGLGIATVYRNLKILNEAGWLRAVELPGEPARYELASLDHHHHFLCEQCGRVFDVPGCLDDLGENIPDDFQVDRYEVLLYGQCAGCTEKSAVKRAEELLVCT